MSLVPGLEYSFLGLRVSGVRFVGGVFDLALLPELFVFGVTTEGVSELRRTERTWVRSLMLSDSRVISVLLAGFLYVIIIDVSFDQSEFLKCWRIF